MADDLVTSWLRDLFGYKVFTQGGVAVPSRSIVEVPSGSLTDDPVGKRTIYDPTGGGTASPTFAAVTASSVTVGPGTWTSSPSVPTTDDSTVNLLASAIAVPVNGSVTIRARVKAVLRTTSALYVLQSASIYAEVRRSGSGAVSGTQPAVVAAESGVDVLPFANPFAGAMTISAAADNGSGAIRLTVDSTANAVNGDTVTVSGLATCTEANGTWAIDVHDGTHVDLRGSAIVHTGADAGTAALLGALGFATPTSSTVQIQAKGIKPAKWIQGEAVTAGAVRWDQVADKTYVCVQAGTTNGSGTGPSGTGTNITDGTAHWDYLAAGRSCPLVWQVTRLETDTL